MFFEAHRLSIFTPRSLDVDVVLDLMIHDLDIVLTFADSPVREVRAVGLPILSPKVDIANVRVEFESGCVANFTASRVSTERVRKLRFFEPRQYVSIDYARQDLLVIRLDADPAAVLGAGLTRAAQQSLSGEIAAAVAAGNLDAAALAQFAASGATPNPGLNFVRPPVTPGEPLRLEIESFLDSVRTRREPRVTARQGRDALALALEIQASMADHARRAGLEDFFAPSP
jgi:predicted dehydrogenase